MESYASNAIQGQMERRIVIVVIQSFKFCRDENTKNPFCGSNYFEINTGCAIFPFVF